VLSLIWTLRVKIPNFLYQHPFN